MLTRLTRIVAVLFLKLARWKPEGQKPASRRYVRTNGTEFTDVFLDKVTLTTAKN